GDVHHVAAAAAAAAPSRVETIVVRARIVAAAAVDGAGGSAGPARDAARIAGSAHTRNKRLDALRVARGRDRREDVLAERLLLLPALNVDDRRLARHRDRFLERADLHFGIDRRDERSGQLDAFPLDRAEAGQREGDAVRPGQQVDDAVLTSAVGD